MKKITLALCACAFALTGLLASCSNESTSANYIDRSSANHEYKYAVYGTITESSASSYLQDEFGAPDKNGKLRSDTSTTTYKVSDGTVNVSWYTNENRNSNYTNYYVSGNVVASSTGSSSSTYDGKSTNSSSSSATTNAKNIWFNFTDVDGTLYVSTSNDTNFVKVEDLAISEDDDAFSGDFGGEFSLNIKVSNDKFYNSYDEDNKDAAKDVKYSTNTTTEYKLTFVPVESFDPEDIEDEE